MASDLEPWSFPIWEAKEGGGLQEPPTATSLALSTQHPPQPELSTQTSLHSPVRMVTRDWISLLWEMKCFKESGEHSLPCPPSPHAP